MIQLKSRQLRLLRLVYEQDDYMPACFFADALNVSTKTILNDLKLVNHHLKATNLQILKSPRRGILLVGATQDFDTVYRSLIKDNERIEQKDYPALRQLEIVKGALIDNSDIYCSDLEAQFYVSFTSIRSDIETLNLIFSEYSVSVHIVHGMIQFSGYEHNIQKALKHYIFDLIISDSFDSVFLNYNPLEHIFSQLFDDHLIALVNHEVDTLIQHGEKVISNWFVESLKATILIQFMRIMNGYHMTQEDIQHKSISHLEPYMVTLDIIQRYERSLGMVFREPDIYYLSQQLYAHGVEPITHPASLLKHYDQIVLNMIETMSHHLNIDLTHDKKLRDALLSHLPPMIYRLKRNIKVKNPLLDDIKNQYMVLFSLTWYVSIGLEHRFDITLTDDEISFLFIYFQVSLERRKHHQFKNIIIVCPYGLATSELVFTRARHSIPYIDNIRIMTTQELYEADLSEVDFVVSTVKLDIDTPPVVYVSPLMDEKDIEKIVKFNTQLSTKANRLVAERESPSCFEHNLIDSDLVFYHEPVQSKQEALTKMIQEFVNKGYVTADFEKRIFDRERMGDTSLYTGVALPHAFPETVKVSKLAIMTVNQDIPWGSNKVRLILLIAFSNHDLSHIRPVLSRLLVLIDTPDFINELHSAPSKEDLITILKEKL